ncbi:pre-mRNA-processing protein 40A [Lactuca sativa]|uniref:pre-mRNA-processing protein 40A n=1 Tax=Lactuca sativa TaxID=4236 RepID=UPI000CD88499|nr:pre-mRNA-processing protein 40A [Lactuca sativa]
MANYPHNPSSQFRFLVPPQQGQFRPMGQGMPPGQSQPPQFSQPHQQMSPWPRPSQPANATSSFIAPPMPYMQHPNMTCTSSSQNSATTNTHLPGLTGPGAPLSSSFTFITSSFGHPQNAMNASSNQQAMNVPNVFQEASSDWQEFIAADGRRYFYNKRTKMSSWEKPLELMTPVEKADSSTFWKEFTTAEGKRYYYNKETKQSKWTIPDELKMAREQAEKEASRSSQSLSSGSSVNDSCLTIPVVAVKPHSPVSPTVNDAPSVLVNTSSSPKTNLEITSSNDVANALDEASMQDIKEAKKDISDVGKVNVTLLEEKVMDAEPLLYANKKEAKLAFRSLLESANLEADWSWEQAMRVIINDKRYGALKTLGERKQAFNEYLVEKKKLEAEEKRLKLKKAKDEFMQMLEESKELTSSMRWSKAIALFEDDKRYKAIERPSEREDLFQDYLVDLKKKERAKLQEEKRQNRLEYRHFLETCGFIKVDTQWRKVKDWLEDDERCSRLEKIDRLEIFQEYIRELEKEDDEQRKLKKEEIKKMERKNRDEFSKMMEEHVVSGMLTVNTQWVDYFQKVKESEAYHAVASNTSGATAKDLFEDVAEELEKKYHDDKTRVKDALKIKKVSVAATWTFKDFKDAIQDDIISPPLSDINLQLVFEDLLKRAKEKEKKEHKRRRNLAKDFTQLLDNIKEINASSTWEDCKQLFEESNVYRSIGDEKFCQVAFEEYVARLVEKGTDNKHKQEDEKMKREKKEKGKDRERKHGQSPIDHRKSRKHVSHESDDESKHKRHKDDGEHVHDHEEELEDGEIC